MFIHKCLCVWLNICSACLFFKKEINHQKNTHAIDTCNWYLILKLICPRIICFDYMLIFAESAILEKIHVSWSNVDICLYINIWSFLIRFCVNQMILSNLFKFKPFIRKLTAKLTLYIFLRRGGGVSDIITQ